MIESDDDASFAFRFNGANLEDSDDEENFTDDANMPGNLPSPNIGFGNANIFNLEEIIELSKNEKKIKDKENKEIADIIEDLRDNCVRNNSKNATIHQYVR